MKRNTSLTMESFSYFFSRSKDVNRDSGNLSITLFGRLAREFSWSENGNVYKQMETVWVDIKEVKMEQAPDKLKLLPNQICRYEITEQIFQDLFHISRHNPADLYSLTPFHIEKQIENTSDFE